MSVGKTTQTEEPLENTAVDRRTFMKGVGVAGAATVGMTGSVAAQLDLDFSSALAPETDFQSTAVVEEIDLSEEEVSAVPESLSDEFMTLRTAPDGTSNSVGIYLDDVIGVRETLDGDLLDPANWEGDGILSSTEEPVDGEPLSFEGAGTDSITFEEPVSVSTDETAQLRYSSTVDSEEGEEITVSLSDETEEETITVEESGRGAFAQVPVEEVEEVSTVEVSITGGGSLDVYGLAVAPEVVIATVEDFGTSTDPETGEEVEEVSTVEVTEHGGGRIWVPSLDSLGSRWEGATIENVEVRLSQLARDLPSTRSYTEEVEVPEEELSETVSGLSTRLRAVANHSLPSEEETPTEISVEVGDLVYTGVPEDPNGRYEVAGYAPDEPETVSAMSDALDLTLSSIVSQADSESEENRLAVELAPEEYERGDTLVTVVDVGLTSDEFDEIQASGFLFFGSDSDDGFLGGARSTILMIAGLVGGAIAWIRSRAASVAGGA